MNQTNLVAVFGAGGHGKVVMDILKLRAKNKELQIFGFLDGNKALHGTKRIGVAIRGGMELFENGVNGMAAVVALGDNMKRAEIAAFMEHHGVAAYTAIHPSAVISESATIGKGCMVITQAVIHPDATVGRHTIVNTGAVIEHDDTIGSFCHIAPGVNLGSWVMVGDFTEIFTNATVIPRVTIGSHCVIGAGAVVLRDVPDGATVVGNPARILKKKEKKKET